MGCSGCPERMRKYVLPKFGYEWIEEIDAWCKDCEFDDDGVLTAGYLVSDEDVEEHHLRETGKVFFNALREYVG
jgi:hypothetical protein